jgi:hypothetical protein
MTPVEDTLDQRHARYGKFQDNAEIAQHLKAHMRRSLGWAELEYDQREALDMIASKIGRIIRGDPNYIDSWHDIAGFATLIVRRLNGDPL